MMDHNNSNNILRNNVNYIQDDNRINSYSNLPTNVIQTRQPSSNIPCNHTNFSATPISYISNNYEQQAMFYNQYTTTTTSTTQYYSTTSSYAPQYIDNYVNQNTPQFNQNIPPPQTNNSQIFRFEIPGFKIIIVPTSSSSFVNLNNLDMEI
jgi:hypothetical protein